MRELIGAVLESSSLEHDDAVDGVAALARLSSRPYDAVILDLMMPLKGGRIVTMDDARPEARAMAIRGDRIVALGSEEELARWVGPSTRVLDLKGALAIPGFIDAHAHFRSMGEQKLILDLTKAKSWD